MQKIVLNVRDENMATVMHILKNLKEGLIDGIDGETLKATRKESYTPKQGKIISEDEKPSGKYASRSSYKNRLNKK